MDFYEIDKMWHDIREKIAEEEKELSVEERVAESKKMAEEYSKKFGLEIVKTTRRGTDR